VPAEPAAEEEKVNTVQDDTSAAEQQYVEQLHSSSIVRANATVAVIRNPSQRIGAEHKPNAEHRSRFRRTNTENERERASTPSDTSKYIFLLNIFISTSME